MQQVQLDPTVLVVFGATGDLMARKVVPSLHYLKSRGLLPERFRVIGVSRRPWTTADFRDHVCTILSEKYPDADSELVCQVGSWFDYRGGQFGSPDLYAALGEDLRAADAEWGGCANKLFYLAVPPEHYEGIFRNLAGSGLAAGCDDSTGWTRVLVEKPFGHDRRSARKLDELLGSLFREEQIYRIDHYLAKEMLQGILNFRFTNNLFEASWDRNTIERIDISLLETLGAEKRGAFYDEVGALRDVGQNHLLQMLALIAMEHPGPGGAAALRSARADFIEMLRPPTQERMASSSYRAQYAGYREIPGVSPHSDTETFFRLDTMMSGRRWAGVPVSMTSGKRVGARARKEIVVTFRHPHPCLCETGIHPSNKVVFRLEPTESISIVFHAKKPGFENDTEERTFDFFLYEREEKLQYVEEYGKLLYDAIRGDQTLFVSTREVAAMWDFVDPVVEAWEAGGVPLRSYEPDTDEPLLAAAEVLRTPPRRGTVGVIGLGRMGAGLARNLLRDHWRVLGYNRTARVAEAMAAEGLEPYTTIADLVRALPTPRVVWVMVPAGDPVEEALFGPLGSDGVRAGGLADLLTPGDTVIDGGNSHYVDAPRRAESLAEKGVRFLDCGTSGGPGGALMGACLMIGGHTRDFEAHESLFADVAAPGAYRFFEGHGAGHFVKMVHNGIEYGMMQAIAEGFEIMHASDYGLDLERVAEVYQHGSVIESRLVGWLGEALAELGDDLEGASPVVGHTGEGAWTVLAGEKLGLHAAIIEGALEFRKQSAENPRYAGRVLTALRDRFGGHGLSAK